MLNAKQVADIVTYFRVILGLGLVWLGLAEGAGGIGKAVLIMLVDWTGDAIDGRIARRSKEYYHSWIGDHDLEVDMAVSCGLLVYMITAGFVNPWFASAYIIFWTFVLWRWKNIRVLGMLSQAPVYAYFIYTALVVVPSIGLWILVWLVIAIILTWPLFPRTVVPGFLDGMREFLINSQNVGEDK